MTITLSQTAISDWFSKLVSDCKTIISEAKEETGRLLLEARYQIGIRILEDYERFGPTTQEDLARELGWSQETVSRIIGFAEKVKEKHEGSFEKFIHDVNKVPSWHKLVNEWLPQPRALPLSQVQSVDPGETSISIENIDCKDSDLSEESIDMIFTDPPWLDLKAWDSLGKLAGRVLKSDGWLLAETGKKGLSDILDTLGDYLHYYWMIAFLKKGNAPRIPGMNIVSEWTPIAVFTKNPNPNPKHKILFDLIESPEAVKDFHKWGKNPEALSRLMDAFTKPGDLVLDPFAGGGSTIEACRITKRSVIGYEKDPYAFELLKKRFPQ